MSFVDDAVKQRVNNKNWSNEDRCNHDATLRFPVLNTFWTETEQRQKCERLCTLHCTRIVYDLI